MASITINDLADNVKNRLFTRAKANNRSMTEEARIILRDALSDEISQDETEKEMREVPTMKPIFCPHCGSDLTSVVDEQEALEEQQALQESLRRIATEEPINFDDAVREFFPWFKRPPRGA